MTRLGFPREQVGTAVAFSERPLRYGDRDGADARLGATTLDEEKRLLDAMPLAAPR